ncbi:NAD-dependent epimerase/dehydratase family protein [bacterium]|nr:NAD-dependent epimerase/dehydratase family protein [bacterium]
MNTDSDFRNRHVLVIGGAGFIGSHIVDYLINHGAAVDVYDNLSTGNLANLEHVRDQFRLIKGDILETAKLTKAMSGIDLVCHLAANADVRGGIDNTYIDLQQNVVGTHSVLEAMKNQGVGEIVFSSSATVYGEPAIFPTPENTELIQTSVYGASKLAGEAYIQAYCEYFGMRSYIFRFVSWIGERYSHGVVYDFVKKLQQNPQELEILGDGKQRKSYLYVADGVEGIFHAVASSDSPKNVFNLGHLEDMTVVALADIVVDEMGLDKVAYHFAGGARGWLGDSPLVLLDTSKLNQSGWKPLVSLEEGIRRTVRYLLDHPEIMTR